jgi:hypothetical protein
MARARNINASLFWLGRLRLVYDSGFIALRYLIPPRIEGREGESKEKNHERNNISDMRNN